jgi:uncharacterized protein
VSGIFANGGDPAGVRRRRVPSSRPRALLPTLACVVALVILLSVFVELWTSKLWFDSVGYSSVFTTLLWTRLALFAVFGLVLATVVVGNVVLAYRLRPMMFDESAGNATVERYQDTLDPIRRWVLVALGVLLTLFGGASAAGQWKTYLLWRNGVPFKRPDLFFHRDIGFFVFSYPWYRYLLSFGFTVLVLTLIATSVTHYVYGGIRLQAPRDRVSAGAQVQLSVLLGLFMLLKAAAYWMDRFGLAVANGHLFTGISYTDAHAVLPSKNVLLVIALICAALFFGNVFRPGWMLPVLGFGLLILSAILLGGIWPLIVQQIQVHPSEADKETPYIQRNINATRTAYGLDSVHTEAYTGVTHDNPQQLQTAASTLPGVRLIDPRLVSRAFENLQQVRGFYQMPDVLDVDRYPVPGQKQPQDVVIGVRELDLNGLLPSQRNWTNDHTVYTHGYGVVAAYGDERGPNGQPVWAEHDLPSRGVLGTFEQQVYYGETAPEYSIVGAPAGSPPVELNIPNRGQNSTYHGKGGVPIGSTFRQLLYAAKFQDASIVLSGRVNSASRIIYDREPRLMVEKVAPWLTLDGDTYPAVVNGRLLWILDGYTTTANYPMSELVNLNGVTNDSLTTEQAVAGQRSNNVNYLRNSVKATVDAYNGTVTLYAWDSTDPILKAWQAAFPGVVKDKSQISPQLLAHLRFPEDLFKVKRYILSRYHITDPHTFYSGEGNWVVPEDPTVRSAAPPQPPFYLTVKLPNAPPEFSLTSVYVPQKKQNLASFMAVNADATSRNYGRLTLLRLPSNSPVPGPGLAQNVISTNPQVANRLLRYTRTDTTPELGNLLTLPIGNELLYVQPVYTSRASGAASYPVLQFVALSIGNDVGIGTSFQEAFAKALGLSTEPPNPPPPPTTGGNNGQGGNGTGNETTSEKLARYLDKAQSLFQKAQKALDAGRLGDYQTLNNRGLRVLGKAVDLQQSASSASSQSGNGGSTPSSPNPGG